MGTIRETLRKQFAAMDELVAELEQGRRSWHEFWPLLAEVQSLVQHRQPGGSSAGEASLELGRTTAAARFRNVAHVRASLRNAQLMLKLVDSPA